MEQEHHWFSSNSWAWATSSISQLDAEEKALQHAGITNSDITRLQKRGYPGIYLWSCKVLKPQESEYDIEFYAPKNVPVVEARNGYAVHKSKDGVKIWHEQKRD